MTGVSSPEVRGPLYMALDRLSWTMLAGWRNSFLSKAIMALSISALFLANVVPVLREHGIKIPQMDRMFLGSVLYLLGCVIFAFRAQPQLSRGGEIHDIVARMKTLTDWNFFDGYRRMAKARMERIEQQGLYPIARKGFLEKSSKAAEALTAGTINWIDQTAGLYQAYLQTLDLDRPIARACTAALLASGTALLFWPVAVNVFRAAMGLLCR